MLAHQHNLSPIDRLVAYATSHPAWFVLAGAGCSTGSGIPDYRDREGEWKRDEPVHLPQFLADEQARRRYWARSLVGWPPFAAAEPNRIHAHLAVLEQRGKVRQMVTQNVDGLHQRAGSRAVIDLHGRLDTVLCLDCGARCQRAAVQDWLATANPHWAYRAATVAPDGDVDLDGADYTRFNVIDCPRCGGVLKPDVVFFGENVPRARVEEAMAALAAADLLLVVGSSLMVYSGYRFVRAARAQDKPVVIVNQGKTRGDDDASLKLEADAQEVLEQLVTRL